MAKSQSDSSLKKIHLDPIPVFSPRAREDLLVERADDNELRRIFNKVTYNLIII
jgi:hypothetical protein